MELVAVIIVVLLLVGSKDDSMKSSSPTRHAIAQRVKTDESD